MQAGICKIVPPTGWRPPFAINEKTFRFRTRVQQLNCIEGHSRAEGQFVEALRLFLYQRGQPMKELPRADGQLVNLRLLYKTVASLGGFNAVCSSSRWEQVVRRVGRTKAASEPSEQLCSIYKAHYEATLLAYEQQQRAAKDSTTSSHDTAEIKVQATPAGANAAGDTKATPSSKPRTLSGRKRPAFMKREETEDEHRVKRTLFSDGEHTSSEENDSPKTARLKDEQRRVNLEPEALKPLDTRKTRLGAPEIRAGQKFYRFFPDAGAVLAEVKRVFGGKKPHVAVRYLEDGSNDDIELSTMEILIANGWDASAAELAYNSEICQVCLRGDCWDRMLLCDGCNSGQHIFCLDKPLDKVPTGDWYCTECVEDAMDPEKRKENPKFGFDMGAEISMVDYKERADAWKRNYFSLSSEVNPDEAISDRDLEAEYWRLLSIPVHEQRLEVQYGSDRWKNLTTKAKSDYVRQLSEFFSHGLREGLAAKAGGENYSIDAAQSLEELLQRYAQDDWNLNNMPKLPGSVLQYLDEDIKGIMVPWLYAGMCFSTFCWHVEDHNFYSTSYLHCGAPKTWYGIPSASAEHFERTMKELTPELFGSQPDLHMQLVTMFSPKTLREHGVPVYRATHRPNEFIVTFPLVVVGAKSLKKYREFRKLPVFCHEALVCTLAETLADGDSFEFEHTRSSLLPAVEQLLQDYREFQRRVESSEMRVVKRELMAEYEKHGAVVAADSEASSTSSMRRSMVARACNKPSKMGGNRGSKMKMETSETSMRPTRMTLLSLKEGRSPLSLVEFESLLMEADKLRVEPSAIGKLRDVVGEWRAVRAEAIKLLNTVQRIVNDEIRNNSRPRSSSADTSLVVQSMGAPNVLLHDNVHFGRLCTAITSVSERLRAKKESSADGSFLSQLARGQRYLEVLCKVNVLAATIVGQVERVLGEVQELRLANPNSIANAGALRQLVAATEAVATEIEEALRDRSKSSEELEVLLRRAASLPIPSVNTQNLKDRLEKCRLWECRAHQILAVSGSSSCKAMVERPSLEETPISVEFVSAASPSPLALQDCRRWYDAVHALFLRPSNSHLPLAPLATTLRLSAVLNERAHVVTCQQCQQYFHPPCVPELMPQRSKEAFFCASCRPQRKRTDRDTEASPIFCLCRGIDQAPMICCDFCDEWYHASCVDLNLYYMDKKLLRRECLGRRPALARVESFLAQMQTQLVACPPGARQLIAYIHAVKTVERDVTAFVRTFASRAFSPAAYATEQYVQSQEGAVIQLMERVTNLEVGLETRRACQLVLGPSDRAPRYAHLVALLQDVKSQEPGFAFPRQEYRLMQLTIAERVNKAAQWLRAAKTLEVEEWNVEKARLCCGYPRN
ncbi:Zinc finger, PHD-finger [Phytophthora cactorum]|nr:Zinc finger, PHD-finger [Phytophthora cactorum]